MVHQKYIENLLEALTLGYSFTLLFLEWVALWILAYNPAEGVGEEKILGGINEPLTLNP